MSLKESSTSSQEIPCLLWSDRQVAAAIGMSEESTRTRTDLRAARIQSGPKLEIRSGGHTFLGQEQWSGKGSVNQQ